MDFDSTNSPGSFFTSLVRELKALAISNIEYFKDGKLSHHAKFHVAFCMLFEYLDLGVEPCFREISQRVHEFDASPLEKGNGYRSLLRIVQKCCLHLLQICRHVSTNRDSMLFRRAFYMKELEAYVATLGQLRACLYYAQKLMTYSQAGCLFADEEVLDKALAEQLLTDVEMLSQDCFYGRCLGFQFCESMQRPLNVVAIAMASFAEGYQENSQIMKLATSLFNSGKYILNPDLRAQQVVNVTRTADVQFCKAFWSITESELMHQLPSMVCPSVQVDEVFHLGPDAFDMPSADGNDEVTITPPCAHTGPAPVQVRLISYHLREGQEQHLKSSKSPSGRTPPKKFPRSRGLLVHCHGGGFVAQSSRSHEVYLRDWAKDLGVPILSIDYSLAPESPFPRALEECFYAYAWAVHNCQKLGSTGEVIILAGDSAGGNLMVSTAMRAVSFNIRRPDGILGVYIAVLVRYTPSPARLLCLMDPLLPAGILSRCLAAYAGVSDELSSELAASVNCHIESSAATLRLSAHESQESDWVVINQDSAAKTTSTVTPANNMMIFSGNIDANLQKVEMAEDDPCDEVEIFSRQKATGNTISSFVSNATDKFVSYVGSYTSLLSKSLISVQTAEEIPLLPIDGHCVEVAGEMTDLVADKEDFSLDASPSTPSFHTPMTTPTDVKGAACAHISGDLVALKEKENSACPENQGNMFEVNLETVEIQSNTVSNFAKSENMSRATADNFCAPQSSLTTPESNSVPVGQHPVCNNARSHSIDDLKIEELLLKSHGFVPTLPDSKAELLQFELDNSVVGNTASTTVPRSLVSSSSDELNSYEILEAGHQSIAEQTNLSDEKRSDTSLSSPFKSACTDMQFSKDGYLGKEDGTAEFQEKSENRRQRPERKDIDEFRLKNTSQTEPGEDIWRKESLESFITNSELKTDISSHQSLKPMFSSSVDIDSNPYIDQHLSFELRNDEAEKLESYFKSPSNTPDGGMSNQGPKRENLHLDLCKTVSKSSLARSASQPVLSGTFISSRTMSPSDFKREQHMAQSPFRAIRNISIVKNPYMSPLLAPDWLLKGLPHLCLVACHLDPLLDDTIMFTRRLRSLDISVDLLLLDDLPHGFLNFSLASHDAKRGSELCIDRKALRYDHFLVHL